MLKMHIESIFIILLFIYINNTFAINYVAVEDDFENLCYNDHLGFTNFNRPPNRCERLPHIRVEKREYLTFTIWCIVIINTFGNFSNVDIEYDRGVTFGLIPPEQLMNLARQYQTTILKERVDAKTVHNTKFSYALANSKSISMGHGFFPNTTVGKIISFRVNGNEICDPKRIDEPDPIFPNQIIFNKLKYYETCSRINQVRLATPNKCEQLPEVNLLLTYYPVTGVQVWCLTIDSKLSPERYPNGNISLAITMYKDGNFIEEDGGYERDNRTLPYEILHQNGSAFEIVGQDRLVIAIQPKNESLTITAIKSIIINGVDSCDPESSVPTLNIFQNFTNTAGLQSDRKPWDLAIYKKTEFSKRMYLCDGLLLGPNSLITTAHCIDGLNLENLEIIDRKYTRYSISNIIQHKNFIRKTFTNDAAIIKLNEPVVFTSEVMPICHSKPETMKVDLFKNLVATIVDWRTAANEERYTQSTLSDVKGSEKFIQQVYNEIGPCKEHRPSTINFVFG